MLAYILRRLILIVPTLLGIMLVNFVIIEFAPGGPIEQMIAQSFGAENAALTRMTGGEGDMGQAMDSTATRLGLSQYQLDEIRERFGFDKPMYVRFGEMMWRYITFDFGEATFRSERVVDIVLEKMPVSISLGLWTTLITYLISIPLGIAKATRDGTRFDVWSSIILVGTSAIPSFLLAIVLLTFFAGGQFWNIFPNRGLFSSNFEELTMWGQIKDYFWHLALPLTSMIIGAFVGLAFLTKNTFIDQIRQQYVLTARAKGLSNSGVLYGHVFRNAMLIVIAGFPAALIGILFSSSLLIEIIFSLDGLGLLGYEAAIKRDYGIVFGTLYFFSLFGLLIGIVSDVMLAIIDPRIDFEAQG